MLTIRLQRLGKKKQPTYRLVISEKARDTQGKALEILGHYNPVFSGKTLEVKEDRIKYWLSKGAGTSETVHNLLVKAGVISDDKKKKSVAISKKRHAKINEKAEADKAAKEEVKAKAEEEKKAAEEAAKEKAEEEKAAAEAAKAEAKVVKAEEAPAEDTKEEKTTEEEVKEEKTEE